MQPRQSPQQGGDVIDLRDYLAVLRRRFLVIVILASLGLGLALGYSKLQTPLYTATAHVLINPPPGSTSQNLSNVISVDTEAQVARSAPIAIAAAADIGTELIPTQLLKHVSVSSTPNTFVLDISYWDPNPNDAALGANAFAKAYLDNRKKQADELISEQESSIEAQIGELQREQRVENAKLEVSSPGSIAYRNAQDALGQISIRLAVLASSLAELPQFVEPGAGHLAGRSAQGSHQPSGATERGDRSVPRPVRRCGGGLPLGSHGRPDPSKLRLGALSGRTHPGIRPPRERPRPGARLATDRAPRPAQPGRRGLPHDPCRCAEHGSQTRPEGARDHQPHSRRRQIHDLCEHRGGARSNRQTRARHLGRHAQTQDPRVLRRGERCGVEQRPRR